MGEIPTCSVQFIQYHENRIITVDINDCMIDTGSNSSYVHRRNIGSKFYEENVRYEVGYVKQKSMIKITKAINVNLKIEDNREIANCEICILEDENIRIPAIIGMDLISDQVIRTKNISISHSSEGFQKTKMKENKIEDLGVNFLRKTVDTRESSVYLRALTLIEPHSEINLPTSRFKMNNLNNLTLSRELEKEGLVLGENTNAEKASSNRVKISNLTDKTFILEEGTTVLNPCSGNENKFSEDWEEEKILNFLVYIKDVSNFERVTLEKELVQWRQQRDE